MKTTITIAITTDNENNAEVFWDSLRASHPSIAYSLGEGKIVHLTLETWKSIRQLPGFSDGPNHAKDALIEYKY